jgi:two-component system, sensor histidine kinase
VDAFSSRHFDCILMDMQMPEMDGIEAIRQIRALERAGGRQRTPIICVSANALAEHVTASRRAGADGHLAKPFRPQALLEALSSQLAAA